MAVTAISLARVSSNLRAFNLLEALKLNQRGLFRTQTSLATGFRFSQPSEDPIGAATASNFDRRLEWMDQVKSNLSHVNAVVGETETAMQEATDLVSQAHTLAIQAVGDTLSSDERHGLVTVIDSITNQLVSVGNRKYLNTYLFSGRQDGAPFEFSGSGVVYAGDADRRETLVDTDRSEDSFTVPGQEFFGAVSGEVRGAVDLNPALSAQTLVADLGGARGRGVQLGRIHVTAPAGDAEIDLSGAATVGDVIDLLNASLPAGVQATLGTHGIDLLQPTLPGPVTVSEVGGGSTAADLGLGGTFATADRAGDDLDPQLTLLTHLSDLRDGAGLDLSSGLVIRCAGRVATVSFDGAETIQDILNPINQAGAGVWARIADDGQRLEIRSRTSGTDLTVEENGGQAATALGLRSLFGGTLLSSLNGGRGVSNEAGHDLRLTTADGTAIDIDVDGLRTLADLIGRINAQAAGALTADLVPTGNGLRITDHTVGPGTLHIAALNNSLAMRDLGLTDPALGNQLVGRDVNPQRVDSPFTALLELRGGMDADDTRAMTLAAERLDRVLKRMQTVQGQMASRARMMAERAERVDAETSATQVALSDVRDVDFADAVVRFQQLQTALQANLSTAMKVLNLSMMDYWT